MSKKWPRRDLILFFEKLELYISSGLSLNKAFAVLQRGVSSKQSHQLRRIQKSIESGSNLANALRASVHIPETCLCLIEQGESSGSLSQSLRTVTVLLEREDDLKKKCLSAMAYPVIIGVFAGLLVIGLMKGVMPQILPMLQSLHVELPLLTRAMMFISENMTTYGLVSLLSAFMVCVILLFLYRKVRFIRYFVQSIFGSLPIIGRLIRHYTLAIFLHSCGALFESGLGMSESYSRTAQVITFLPLRKYFDLHIEKIRHGVSISTAFTRKSIPAYISPLLLAGESSGTLGQALLRAASILDRDIEHSLKRLTSLIEPVMMAGMGSVVGAIALSIMMPIYDISKVLQK